MRLVIITGSILAMCASLGYAARREYRPDPQAEYERINWQYFDGKLPRAIVRYEEQAGDTVATTNRENESLYRIAIEPGADLATLKHEACHTVTFDEPEEHGPL